MRPSFGLWERDRLPNTFEWVLVVGRCKGVRVSHDIRFNTCRTCGGVLDWCLDFVDFVEFAGVSEVGGTE